MRSPCHLERTQSVVRMVSEGDNVHGAPNQRIQAKQHEMCSAEAGMLSSPFLVVWVGELAADPLVLLVPERAVAGDHCHSKNHLDRPARR